MQQTNEQFYQDLFQNVYKYVYFRVGNKQIAEDITSETVTRLLEKRDLSHINNLNYFAIGIARNLMSSHFKQPHTVDTDASESLISSTEPEMGDMVLTEEMVAMLKQELQNLNELSAEIIVLRVWQDLQFNEIATLTNTNENTVRSLYLRGVEKLKAALNTPKPGYKLYSFSLPLILAGFKTLLIGKDFAPSTGFLSNLVTNALNLNIILPSMAIAETGAAVAATTSATTAASTTAGGILSTITAKIIIGTVAVGTVAAGTAVGGVILYNQPKTNNSQSSSSMVTTSPSSTTTTSSSQSASTTSSAVAMKTCTNSDLKISIDVPATWGCSNSGGDGQYYLGLTGNSITLSIGTDAIGSLSPNIIKKIIVKESTINIYQESNVQGFQILGEAKSISGGSNQVFGSISKPALTEADFELLTKIFSTYKSTQANAAMKSCTDSNLKISLQIPQTWKCTSFNQNNDNYLAIEGETIAFSIRKNPLGGEVVNLITKIDLTTVDVSIFRETGRNNLTILGTTNTGYEVLGSIAGTTLSESDYQLLNIVFMSYKNTN